MMSPDDSIAGLRAELDALRTEFEASKTQFSVSRDRSDVSALSQSTISQTVVDISSPEFTEAVKRSIKIKERVRGSVKEVLKKEEEKQEEKQRTSYPEDTYSFIALGFFQRAAEVKEEETSDGKKDCESEYDEDEDEETQSQQNDAESEKGRRSCLPFLLGILVFVFQVSLLVLMLMSKAYKSESEVLDIDNPDTEHPKANKLVAPASFISANSSQLVRTTQMLSIIAFFLFGGESLSDVVQAVLNAPAVCISCDEKYRKKALWLQLSSFLRFLQGLLGCITGLLLVVSSNEVIDIVLNFTAVHFISEFDNLAYELAKNGFYGKGLFEATETVEGMRLPKKRVLDRFTNFVEGFKDAISSCRTVLCGGVPQNTTSDDSVSASVTPSVTPSESQRKEDEAQREKEEVGKGIAYLLVVGILAIASCAILSYIFWIGDMEAKWATQKFRLQFLDDSLKEYSGCYVFNNETLDGDEKTIVERQNDRRLQFVSDPNSITPIGGKKQILKQARVAYCRKERKWILHNDMAVNDPCKVDDEQRLATSEKTLSFDVATAFDGTWKTIRDKSTELIFTGQYDLDDDICGLRTGDGRCDEKLNKFKFDYDGGDCCKTTCDFRQSGDCEGKNLTEILSPIQNIEYIDEKHPCKEPVLSIYGESLTGTIPGDIISVLTETKTLSLENNRINGTLPSQIGTMEQLLSIHLEYNELTGAVPGEFGQLVQLTGLSLYKNEFTGTIPPELGNLKKLEYLFLDDNELTGGIPAEIGNLRKLTSLHLYGNNLIGEIPTEIANLTKMQWLDLSSNFLYGSIPTEFGELTELTELSLAENILLGEIPVELGSLDKLRILHLNQNWLTDTIPPAIGDSVYLRELWLHDNTLGGKIPHSISKWKELRSLRLHNNALTGTLPSQIGDLTKLTALSLRDNQLTGRLPSEIAKLTNLRFLDFHGNNFTEIPCEVIALIENNNLDPNVTQNIADFDVETCAPSSMPSSLPSASSSPSSLPSASSSPSSLPSSRPTSLAS